MDVNFEEDQEWEEQAVVIAKRVEEEYQKEKLRSNQMQQNEDESVETRIYYQIIIDFKRFHKQLTKLPAGSRIKRPARAVKA